ncbi:MAG: tRNA preQ1(34) S-adenosylmethionine ribosyltransferase-isomerase QueA [Candidatus Omnitrophota bacterium]
MRLQLTNFDFNLPKDLIAQYPLEERDAAKLIVIDRKKNSVEHRIFKDIKDYFSKGDTLILNDTKVLPCRFKGVRKTGGKVEVLLLSQEQQSLTFKALIKPNRLKQGETIIFNSGKLSAEIISRNKILFCAKDASSIYAYGQMPLPPYIKREPEVKDAVYYQTVYAKNEGAVASPTAGLHFTEKLINALESFGVNVSYVTLHVGLGTFKPVITEDIRNHRMDSEYYLIPQETIRSINDARLNKKRIIAVGTTSLRTLEAYASKAQEGFTDLFIYPGYKFKITDCLLTNFHLPRTTLFMLVCAFCGIELVKKAYQEAIDRKYRFYSYGDAMLIL